MISISGYLRAKRNRNFASREQFKERLASGYKRLAPTALGCAWLMRLNVLAAVIFIGLLLASPLQAQAKRVVLLKVDGLPYQTIDRFVRERDPQTGKSRLPWFEHIFYQNGTRLTNFYVRGMSLSGPSWSLIDTGHHLQIKGNVEFDRYIFHTYDYLNFMPFYFKQAYRGNVDMPGTEVIDLLGLPLLMDAYDNYQRLPGPQLYGRGARLGTLQRAGQAQISRNPIQLAQEFYVGLDLRHAVFSHFERELVEALNDPRVRYLDLFDMSFDHAAHHTNDRESHLAVLRKFDALLGRIWTGIEKSPLASETVLVVVSDHGFNTDERVLSQGFNLVKLLGTREGGGHHVITKRRLLLDYSIKGINPFVPPIVTTTSQTYYLKGQSTDYSTVLLDFDGNERAGLHLRNSDLNVLHILLQELQRKNLTTEERSAATNAFFAVIARNRAGLAEELTQIDQEVAALRRATEAERARCESQPKKFTVEDREMGRDDNARRICIHVTQWTEMAAKYAAYVGALRRLLSLHAETFVPAKLKIEELIPKNSMGRRNSIYNLQNYVVGLGSAGLVLKADGSLDVERSFVRINYFDFLKRQTVRNNVQPGISNTPIDFLATRIPREWLSSTLSDDLRPDGDPIWLYGGPDRQVLILPRGEGTGQLHLRYLPIANLTQDEQGTIRFKGLDWRADLPLRIFEDARLETKGGDRTAWLNTWHTDVEWLRALHKTQYSNALIGLHEQFTLHVAPNTDVNGNGISEDERLVRALRRRQRRLAETDFQVFANNHWNFDVRGFNPGGNHGSFFRVSTQSTFMLAGDGVPRGLAVNEPYDSLSVVPTILALTGNLKSDNSPSEALSKRGFVKFPGRVVIEITGQNHVR
ncbi:MAG TPA: alkaline phosphatase family protein [Pyrinomonadaceae bacterium]|nr:alkaline phosphatase family protein [Pyrinomonadaceae bacterium]